MTKLTIDEKTHDQPPVPPMKSNAKVGDTVSIGIKGGQDDFDDQSKAQLST